MKVEIRVQPWADGTGWSLRMLCPPGVSPRDIEEGPMMFANQVDEERVGGDSDRLVQTEGIELSCGVLGIDDLPSAQAAIRDWLRSLKHEADFIQVESEEFEITAADGYNASERGEVVYVDRDGGLHPVEAGELVDGE
jgi:hypothetical protein